ncbi:hypothetical protein DFH28DRAFT_1056115 [Melampsora americana]|nr:hypothetical protein DFH28DRAFT_1056115 [Melampsora americana]
MHLNLTRRNGRWRFPVSANYFTLAMILCSTVKLVFSLEFQLHNTLENTSIEEHSIHELEPHKGRSMDIPFQDHLPNWSQMGNPKFINSNPMGTEVWEPSNSPTLLPNTFIDDHPHVNEYDYTGQASSQLPHQNFQNLEDIWDESHIIHDKGNDMMELFPGYNHLLLSDGYTPGSFGYTSQNPEYDYMHHSPIQMPHQSFEDFGHSLKGSHISRYEDNYIMNSFTNHHHQFSANIPPTDIAINPSQKLPPRSDFGQIYALNPLENDIVKNMNHAGGLPQNSNSFNGLPGFFDHHIIEPHGLKEHEPGRDLLHDPPVQTTSDSSHKKTDLGDILPGEAGNLPTRIQISRYTNIQDVNLLESQGENCLKSFQESNLLKRKASNVFTESLDGDSSRGSRTDTQKVPRKETQESPKDIPYGCKMIKSINMPNDGLFMPKGITCKYMVQAIQDEGMKAISRSEGLSSQNKQWFDEWRYKMVKSIYDANKTGILTHVNQDHLLKAVKATNCGIVMGFMGLLTLMESQIELHTFDSNILTEGLGFIESYLDDVSSLLVNNLPHLTHIRALSRDTASNPLECFLALTLINRRKDVKVQLYHNIWTKWKSQKATSTSYLPLTSFCQVLYRITLPQIKGKKIRVSNPKKTQSKVPALTNSQLHDIRCEIVNKGKQSMSLFKNIFNRRNHFFQGLRTDLLDRLEFERKNMKHEYYVHFQKLIVNAIKVVNKTVVDGFFGVVKCLHEENNSGWDLDLILKDGWTYLQHHFSSWRLIPLEKLLLKDVTSKVHIQQKLSPELEYVAKSFHIVMKASSTNVISQRLVQSLLRNWIQSFNTDQKDFQVFQNLLRSQDETPLIRWFKFQ